MGTTQNKMIRFILNLDNRAHIGNKERVKAGFLNVTDRVKQLKLGHVFKIKSKTSPYYLSTNFQRLNENENRIVTRAQPIISLNPGYVLIHLLIVPSLNGMNYPVTLRISKVKRISKL